MNPNIKRITVDLAFENNFDYVTAVQGDSQTRYVYITLLDNQCPYELSDVEPVLRGTKPDGTTIFNHCEISDNNEIIVELDSQILSSAGIGEYEIALYNIGNDDQSLTSFPFRTHISPAKFNPDEVISSNEFNELTSIIKNVGVINNSVTSAENFAKIATEKANESLENANFALNSAMDSKQYAENSEQSSIESTNQANLSLQYAKNSEKSSELSSQMATNASDYADQSLKHAEYSEEKSIDSKNNSLLSKSYAIGETGIREQENIDNSKYYAELAANSSTSAANYLEKVELAGNEAVNKINDALSMNIPSFYFEPLNGHLYYEGGRFRWVLDPGTGHLYWEVSL